MNFSEFYARGLVKLKLIVKGNILPIYNRFLLEGMGASFGKNCDIVSLCGIRIDRESIVKIGDNFRLVGNNIFNPLCKSQTCIVVRKGAILIIGNQVGMSSPTIWVHKSLTIGDHVNIGGGTVILDSDCHSLCYLDRRDHSVDQLNKHDKGIVIEDDVLVGAFCIILKGVHIGARSIIGAGSVVTKDIPSDCIAAGNPCKVIKSIK